mmetsp:Transcript_23920/g.52299  ORF Transcript_23920/g.52299 Transcript_23920/m.52299 type:complete len:205 (+) Transcript_23920:274-888(+)
MHERGLLLLGILGRCLVRLQLGQLGRLRRLRAGALALGLPTLLLALLALDLLLHLLELRLVRLAVSRAKRHVQHVDALLAANWLAEVPDDDQVQIDTPHNLRRVQRCCPLFQNELLGWELAALGRRPSSKDRLTLEILPAAWKSSHKKRRDQMHACFPLFLRLRWVPNYVFACLSVITNYKCHDMFSLGLAALGSFELNHNVMA